MFMLTLMVLVIPGSKSPLLDSTGSPIFSSFLIKTLDNGVQIGICGVTLRNGVQNSNPVLGTTAINEYKMASACVKRLTILGMNKIILLSHVGLTDDVGSLSLIPDLDVIIGGHTHSLLGGASFATAGFKPEGPYSLLSNGVCIVTSWEYSKVVGRLDVTFDKNGVVSSCGGTARIPLNTELYEVLDAGGSSTVYLDKVDSALLSESLVTINVFREAPADEQIEAVIAPYRSKMAAVASRSIGVAAVSLCHSKTGQESSLEPDSSCPGRQISHCLSGGVVCSLVAQGFLYSVPSADIALQNNGGCRSNILRGRITYSDIFDVVPFVNTLVTFNMTGNQIKAALEDAAANFLEGIRGTGGGSYPIAAGLRWDVDYRKAFPNRFSNLEINVRLEQDEWTPLDPDATYRVVTNSYIASGRDGYVTFAEVGSSVDTMVDYTQSFVAYVESHDGPLNEPSLSDFSSKSMVLTDGRICEKDADIFQPSQTSDEDSDVALTGKESESPPAAPNIFSSLSSETDESTGPAGLSPLLGVLVIVANCIYLLL
jgi:5'-nucleotidase / UDP-sugar diphosphatase